VRLAASLAARFGARLVAVHVLDRLTTGSRTAERVAAEVLYDEVPDAGAEARGEIGDVAERLAAVAHREAAAMIVLGARSRGRSRSFLRTRCAVELAERTNVPVVVAPLQSASTPTAIQAASGRRIGPTTAIARTNASGPAVSSAAAVAPSKAAIVVTVDGSAASLAAAEAAIELSRDTDSSLLFVYLRRRPSSIWGAPFYQRRLSREMRRARSALEPVVRLATEAGVDVDADVVEGSSRRRVVDFAAARGAWLIVEPRRFRRTVSGSGSILRYLSGDVVAATPPLRRRRAEFETVEEVIPKRAPKDDSACELISGRPR
jgi:nucleotide-binding universal stress UspA family protein